MPDLSPALKLFPRQQLLSFSASQGLVPVRRSTAQEQKKWLLHLETHGSRRWVKALATTSTTISSCKVSPCWRGRVCNKMTKLHKMPLTLLMESQASLCRVKWRGFRGPALLCRLPQERSIPYSSSVPRAALSPCAQTLPSLEAAKLVFYGIVPSGPQVKPSVAGGTMPWLCWRSIRIT